MENLIAVCCSNVVNIFVEKLLNFDQNHYRFVKNQFIVYKIIEMH